MNGDCRGMGEMTWWGGVCEREPTRHEYPLATVGQRLKHE